LPIGYVVLMISLARAGDLDHKDFAHMICASESKTQSRGGYPVIFNIIGAGLSRDRLRIAFPAACDFIILHGHVSIAASNQIGPAGGALGRKSREHHATTSGIIRVLKQGTRVPSDASRNLV
jgi:hypothetical protein